MIDVSTATLGFSIDSSQASGAAANLDDLAASANRTTAAVDKLETEAATLGTSLGKAGRGAREAQAPVESLGRTLGQQDDHVRAFRMEVERLTAKYQPLAAATKSYEASVSEIERAHRMGILSATQMQRALDAERMAYERLKNSATTAGAAMKAANANAAPSGAQRAASANLGFQFQDIAVTSAMGMSPLMIGLQQGTQLASVLGTMEKPITGLAAAFGSIINPVSLITIGLTAGTAALIQYFMTSDEGSGKMNADLKEQLDIITSVAEKWGDSVPALREYADELVRAQEASELSAGLGLLNEKTLANVKGGVSNISLSISDLVAQLQAAGEETEVVLNLQDAFNRFVDAAKTGSLTVTDVNNVQTALAGALNSTGIPAIESFREEFDALAKSALDAAGSVQSVNEQAAAAAALTGRFPSRGTYGGVIRSPDFTIQNLDMLPETGPIPRPRPNIELNGDGSTAGAPMILNSDGRLVPVPTPGARPNYFEQEALQPAFNSTRTGANSWDRSILMEEMRRNEMGSMVKGFITDFGSVLRESGGDLGKAFMQSFANAATNAASQAWDKLAGLASTAIVNLIMGQPSAGLLNKGIGFTGANTTFGSFLGASGGLIPANQNTPSAMPGGDIASYIAKAATARGIDPDIALRVAKAEGGLDSWNLQSGYSKNGFREPSYGPFQLLKGGPGTGFPKGMGNDFMARTGLDPALAANGPAGIDFALDGAKQNGWGAWYGAAKVGVGQWDGIGAAGDAAGKFAEATSAATDSLGAFGNGLGQMGNTLAQGATGAAGGSGGGLFGWLGGLFGGGGSQWNAAASGKITGLFANGTDYAPGGLAVVGERGPELVNLPEGARVFSNHKSMDMVRGGGNQQNSNMRPILNVHVSGASGDAHVRELARQGAQEVLFQYDQNQTRGGFGQQQQNYAKRKG